MLKEFLIKFEKNKFNEETQNKFFRYNTRLLSAVNGWIDWAIIWMILIDL